MKVDEVMRNAKIRTADKGRPLASALAAKDGKRGFLDSMEKMS